MRIAINFRQRAARRAGGRDGSSLLHATRPGVARQAGDFDAPTLGVERQDGDLLLGGHIPGVARINGLCPPINQS